MQHNNGKPETGRHKSRFHKRQFHEFLGQLDACGFQAMEKALKAMHKDTVGHESENKDFVDLLVDGKKNPAARFADIDAVTVRDHI